MGALTTEPAMPEELRTRPFVEDWVTLAEVADARSKLAGDTINGRPAADDVGAVLWELQMRARRRARDARRRQAAEAGLDASKAHFLIISAGLPRYRDEAVFLAEIRRATSRRPPRIPARP